MMKSFLARSGLAFFLAATLTAGASALCQSAAAEMQAEHAKLTKDMLERWMASYPQVKMLAIAQAANKGKELKGKVNPIEAVMRFADDKEVRAEADAAVKKHGFKNFEEWLGVARATAAAYGRLKAGATDEDAKRSADKLIKKIDDIPFLSEKQKRKLQEKAREEVEKEVLNAPPENVELVRSMEKDLDSVVKSGLN